MAHDVPVLTVDDVQKSYGEIRALRGVSLEIKAGEVVALLGRNGAGKSTLLSIVAGLIEPDAGSVMVDGLDIKRDRAAAATRVGIAPQETGIYRVLTVRDNLEFFGELAGLGRSDRKRRADEVAERLELTELLDRRGSTLSGGEARRLHTACALVHAPPLLLLDEPTVGADVTTRNRLIEAVRELAAEGAAVVYTTHYLPEVESLDAEIIVIDRGQLLARGTQATLVSQHFEAGVEVTFASALAIAEVPDVESLAPKQLAPDRWLLRAEATVEQALHALGAFANEVVRVEVSRQNLEQVFLAITGTSLSEDDTASDEEANA